MLGFSSLNSVAWLANLKCFISRLVVSKYLDEVVANDETFDYQKMCEWTEKRNNREKEKIKIVIVWKLSKLGPNCVSRKDIQQFIVRCLIPDKIQREAIKREKGIEFHLLTRVRTSVTGGIKMQAAYPGI